MWGALNSGAMQVLNAVFGIVLARKLGQADYGLIGMLTIFTLIANSLQDSGFVTALTNKRDATRSDYNSVFWFNISVSLCLYILFFFCAPLIAAFFNEPILTDLSRYYFISFFIRACAAGEFKISRDFSGSLRMDASLSACLSSRFFKSFWTFSLFFISFLSVFAFFT